MLAGQGAFGIRLLGGRQSRCVSVAAVVFLVRVVRNHCCLLRGHLPLCLPSFVISTSAQLDFLLLLLANFLAASRKFKFNFALKTFACVFGAQSPTFGFICPFFIFQPSPVWFRLKLLLLLLFARQIGARSRTKRGASENNLSHPFRSLTFKHTRSPCDQPAGHFMLALFALANVGLG